MAAASGRYDGARRCVRQLDERGRSRAVRAAERERASRGLDPRPVRRQADVAACGAVLGRFLVDPAAVVGNHQAGPSALVREGDRRRGRLGVLDDVAQQLSGRRVQQTVDRGTQFVAPTVELDRNRQPPSGRCRVGEPAQRARQAGVLEHGRVQLGHGGAQQPRALRQCKLQPGERLGVGTLPGVLEVMPRPQQVLQRAVVELLGERPALAILGAHQLPDQIGAIFEQVTDPQHARALDPRQSHAAQADGEQHSRAQRHRVSTARRWPPAWRCSRRGTRRSSVRGSPRRCAAPAGSRPGPARAGTR